VAEFTKNTGKTTLEGGEGGSGDETIVKKSSLCSQRTTTKKGRHFLRKKQGDTISPSVAAVDDINLSDATGYYCI